jgi:hypothetical protein
MDFVRGVEKMLRLEPLVWLIPLPREHPPASDRHADVCFRACRTVIEDNHGQRHEPCQFGVRGERKTNPQEVNGVRSPLLDADYPTDFEKVTFAAPTIWLP